MVEGRSRWLEEGSSAANGPQVANAHKLPAQAAHVTPDMLPGLKDDALVTTTGVVFINDPVAIVINSIALLRHRHNGPYATLDTQAIWAAHDAAGASTSTEAEAAGLALGGKVFVRHLVAIVV